MKKIIAILTLLGAVFSCFAQKTVTGTVLDEETGEALISATIIVKNTTIGVVSDFDGKFSIDIPDSVAQILEISYTGYEMLEFDVSMQTNIIIEMDSRFDRFDQSGILKPKYEKWLLLESPDLMRLGKATRLLEQKAVLSNRHGLVRGRNSVDLPLIYRGIRRANFEEYYPFNTFTGFVGDNTHFLKGSSVLEVGEGAYDGARIILPSNKGDNYLSYNHHTLNNEHLLSAAFSGSFENEWSIGGQYERQIREGIAAYFPSKRSSYKLHTNYANDHHFIHAEYIGTQSTQDWDKTLFPASEDFQPRQLGDYGQLLLQYRWTDWDNTINIVFAKQNAERNSLFAPSGQGLNPNFNYDSLATNLVMATYNVHASWENQENNKWIIGLNGKRQEHSMDAWSYLLPAFQIDEWDLWTKKHILNNEHRWSFGTRLTYLRQNNSSFNQEIWEEGIPVRIIDIPKQDKSFVNWAASASYTYRRKNFDWNRGIPSYIQIKLGKNYSLPSVFQQTTAAAYHWQSIHLKGNPNLKANNIYQLDIENGFQKTIGYWSGKAILSAFANWQDNAIYIKGSSTSIAPFQFPIAEYHQEQRWAIGLSTNLNVDYKKRLFFEQNFHYRPYQMNVDEYLLANKSNYFMEHKIRYRHYFDNEIINELWIDYSDGQFTNTDDNYSVLNAGYTFSWNGLPNVNFGHISRYRLSLTFEVTNILNNKNWSPFEIRPQQIAFENARGIRLGLSISPTHFGGVFCGNYKDPSYLRIQKGKPYLDFY